MNILFTNIALSRILEEMVVSTRCITQTRWSLDPRSQLSGIFLQQFMYIFLKKYKLSFHFCNIIIALCMFPQTILIYPIKKHRKQCNQAHIFPKWS